MTERKTPWTPGPWKAWTSNSHWRVGSGNADGNILCAVRGSDGLPVIHVKPEDARLIAAAPTIAEKAEAVMPSMVAAIDLFKAKGLLRCASDAQQALDDLKAELAAAKGGA